MIHIIIKKIHNLYVNYVSSYDKSRAPVTETLKDVRRL